jgi:ubiquinone/menaquinone biosynthesis C-methylase UbiE
MSSRDTMMSQCRKPEGWLGRFSLWTMNIRHSRVTDWGLGQVSIEKRATILDVGCGGGRTVRKLAALASEGRVCGVDHSEESVASARRTNRAEIETGRVEIRHGSVSRLPYPDGMFDLATAVETHFFWPDLEGDLREILRVLKPGATLMIAAEIYKGGKHARIQQMLERYKELTKMTLLSVDEHRELLSRAGYADVRVVEDYGKGWISGTGRRPA